MFPETRQSLILRLRRPEDVSAWEEFVSIYEPVMIRMGQRRGMQMADIRETVQQVFVSVAGAIVRWSPDAQGRFRCWLSRIFRNQLVDQFRQSQRQASTGAADFSALVDDHQWHDDLTEEIDQEYRREMFRQVAAEVQRTVQDSTWQAFWRTTVEGLPIEEAADQLSMTVGAVYAARSRIVAKIRLKVQTREARDAM